MIGIHVNSAGVGNVILMKNTDGCFASLKENNYLLILPPDGEI